MMYRLPFGRMSIDHTVNDCQGKLSYKETRLGSSRVGARPPHEAQRPFGAPVKMTTSSLATRSMKRVRLLVQEIPIDAFWPQAGDAQLPAGAFAFQLGELGFQLDRLGVEFLRRLEPVLAVRRAPYQIAAGDPEREVESDRQHDRAQASPNDHPPICGGGVSAKLIKRRFSRLFISASALRADGQDGRATCVSWMARRRS